MIRITFLFALCATLCACATRRMEITSEPSGATIWINDIEVGRTPVKAGFTYYGLYDVLLKKDGYEPLRTSARASAPWWEYPPFDLAANALPNAHNTVRWHFTLTPSLESTLPPQELEHALVNRANALRSQLEEPQQEKK